MSRLGVALGVAFIAVMGMAPASAADTSNARTVLAIDVSGSMADGGKIEAARAAAHDLVNKRAGGEQIALVTFSDRPHVVVPFTGDANALGRGIDSLTPGGATALWDALHLTSDLLGSQPAGERRVVVLSDGDDSVSATTFDQARAFVAAARCVVSVIALPGVPADGGRLGALARETGGRYSQSTTLDAAHPGAVAKPGWNPLGASSKWVAVGASLVATALLVVGVLFLVVKRESLVDKALAPYVATAHDAEVEGSAFAQTAFVRRAIALTGRLAARRGFLARFEGDLERADIPVRAPEVLFFAAAAVIVVGLVVFALTGSLVMGALAVTIIGVLPSAVIKFVAGRNRRKFVAQLPDTLNLTAGALRAGYSFLQSLETVAIQIDGPMGKELRRILAEGRLGRDLEDSMEETARRMASEDFDWVVMAVRVQREVGGNLAEVLASVAETMIVRDRLRREIKALTAEGRISMVILGIMPVALGLFLYVVNPDYMRLLFTDRTGRFMAAGATLLAAVGVWWMRKTTEIEL
jgi:Flp pilus assembly protein TadB